MKRREHMFYKKKEINRCNTATDTIRGDIKVLGSGCKFCHEQYENVKKAVLDMGLITNVEYITDIEKIMDYGIMSMPAIVVNEKVVSMGKVLKVSQVKELLKGE